MLSRASSLETLASSAGSHHEAGHRRPPMAEPEAVDSQNSMDKNLRFPDYILSKMAAAGEAAHAGVADRHGAARPCGEAFRVWAQENMLLLITIVGVISGLVLGQLAPHILQKIQTVGFYELTRGTYSKNEK